MCVCVCVCVCVRVGRLPRKLLVCAPTQGRRSVGGQKKRWNDLVQRDLRSCDLEEDWRKLAGNRSEWRSMIRAFSEEANTCREAQEKHRKDEQKRRREARQMPSELALQCSAVGCGFTALNHAGLVNHQRQKHSQIHTGRCKFCKASGPQQPRALLPSTTTNRSNIVFCELGLHRSLGMKCSGRKVCVCVMERVYTIQYVNHSPTSFLSSTCMNEARLSASSSYTIYTHTSLNRTSEHTGCAFT